MRNQETDPVEIYNNYGDRPPDPIIEPADEQTEAVSGISGGGGGTTTGPSATMDGGTTGYQFIVSGNVIILTVNNASTIRSSVGLGTIATQDANNVSITGGSIVGITDLAVADGGTGASTASGARTNLGLGTISVQDANNVTISGGSITGITDLAIADGGTGASTAAAARSNLGAAASGSNSDITQLLGLTGGLRLIGFTTTTADPSTTELPTNKDVAIHKNTTSGIVYLAFNDGGVIKKIALI